jgi:hypothetical protein
VAIWISARGLLAARLFSWLRMAVILDHAAGLAIDVEQVVGKALAGVEHELAQRNALGTVDVGGLEVLHRPAGRRQQAVDLCPGALLRRSQGCCSLPAWAATISDRALLAHCKNFHPPRILGTASTGCGPTAGVTAGCPANYTATVPPPAGK